VSVPTTAEIVALATGAAVTWWWAQPWRRLSVSGLFHALFRGWDNDSHFEMFAQNLKLGSFIQVRADLPGGAKRLGYDYPQGIHQAWAQYVRLLNPRPPSTLPWLLHSYLDVLLLTTGAIVVLGCMAVCRLSGRDLLTALPVMAIVTALFAFGRYGPFTGYPNFDLAIAAGAVAVSLMIRPTLAPRANFFAVSGMGLIVVYNWYLLIPLIAPAIIIAALRARSASHMRGRTVMTVIITGTAVAYVLPAVFLLHRGVSTLNSSGALPTNPAWGLLIVSFAALIGVALFRQRAPLSDFWTNVIIGAPAVLGGVLLIAVAAYTSASTGRVSYYGQKLAEGFLGVWLLVLAYVVASDLARSQFRRRLSAPAAVTATVLLTVAALQVDGYVGPSAGALKSTYIASGLSVHGKLQSAPAASQTAEELLLAAEKVQRIRGNDTAEQWWVVDPSATEYEVNTIPLRSNGAAKTTYANFALLGEWFVILAGDPTLEEYTRSGSLIGFQFRKVRSPNVAAQIVIRDFPFPAKDNIHLVVPQWLETAIVHDDPTWGHNDRLVTVPYAKRAEKS
jgi:hypothetical protein